MEKGGPALIVLLVLPLVLALLCVLLLFTTSVPLLGPRVVAGTRCLSPLHGVRVFAVATLGLALVFWVWSIYSAVSNASFDLGTISFLAPAISAILLLAIRSDEPSVVSLKQLRWQMWVAAFTPVLPALNYFLGAVLVYMSATPHVFTLQTGYFVVGGLFWVADGVAGGLLVRAQLREFQSSFSAREKLVRTEEI